ncbi:MAG: M48 family metalloprotease [Dehalococcoidia bacterium]
MNQTIKQRGQARWLGLLGVVLLAMTGSGCQSLPPPVRGGPPSRSAVPQSSRAHQPLLGLSRQQEIELGRQSAAAIEQQQGLMPAADLESQLTHIADRLAPHTAEPTYRYQVHILNTGEVNAMSLPDGSVFVTRGFVDQLHPTEQDYAAVLGHELSHVALHHLSHRVAAQREEGIAVTLLALLSGRRRAVVAGAILGQLATLQFSRSQEYEADLHGADTLLAAGYDPVAMIHLLQKLERLHPSPSRLKIGLSNHPATRDRIAKVQAHILVTEAQAARH